MKPVRSIDDVRRAERRINEVVVEHRHAVFLHTLRLTLGDTGWAEDVVQETFLKAWRNWEKMTPDHGSVRAWLKRVAHNLVMDEYRSPRRRRVEVPLAAVDDIAVPEVTDQILSAHMIGQALKSLPEEHRRALEVTYLDDQTANQAAVELDIPVGTVKSRVFYGMRMLRSGLSTSADTER